MVQMGGCHALAFRYSPSCRLEGFSPKPEALQSGGICGRVREGAQREELIADH